MPKLSLPTVALALAGTLALTGCTETMTSSGESSASGAVASLRSKGFKPTARDSAGQIIAMTYSGPVTSAVVCGAKGRPKAPIKPQMTDLDGTAKRATLDAYVILNDGKVATGIYAIVLRAPGKMPEGIDFAPGESKAFASGLTCTNA
jgi:hypothetical protein